MLHSFNAGLRAVGKLDTLGTHLMRLAIGIVFLWIGALKFAPLRSRQHYSFCRQQPIPVVLLPAAAGL